jgi:Flp pilus assembly protein TadG
MVCQSMRASGVSKSNRARRFADRKGAVTVETALVLPLMLLFLFGIMEYGRYVLCLQVVTNAAREGCRYAVTHTQPVTLGGVTTGNATSDITNTVTKFLSGQQLSSQSIQVYQSDSQGNNLGSWNSATPGQYVGVQITGNFSIIVPMLLSFPSSISVQSKCVMFCEGN